MEGRGERGCLAETLEGKDGSRALERQGGRGEGRMLGKVMVMSAWEREKLGILGKGKFDLLVEGIRCLREDRGQ